MKQVYRDDAKGMINSPNRTHEINLEVLKRPKIKKQLKTFLKMLIKKNCLKQAFYIVVILTQ